MTKAEVIEAINATIRPNGVKGITAESLANILTEIVNSSAEAGSGSGSSSGGGGGYYIDLTLANPDDAESMELTADAMAHNASVYNALVVGLVNVDYSSAAPITLLVEGLAFSQIVSTIPAQDELNSLRAYFFLPLTGEPSNSNTGQAWLVTEMNVMYIDIRPDGSMEIGMPGLM